MSRKRLSNHVVCQHVEKGAGVSLLISKLLIAASHYQHGTPQDTSPGILLRNVHITIRQYKTDSPKEAARLTNEGFIPLLSNVAGLVAYYGIEAGEDTWVTVSVFETPPGVEESNRVAAEFIKNNPDAARVIKSKPEITAGPVVAHKTK
jgi:hypothetical protein